jgi:hypothetical protein
VDQNPAPQQGAVLDLTRRHCCPAISSCSANQAGTTEVAPDFPSARPGFEPGLSCSRVRRERGAKPSKYQLSRENRASAPRTLKRDAGLCREKLTPN